MDVIEEALDDLFTEIYEYPLWLQLLILLFISQFFDHATLNKNPELRHPLPPRCHPPPSLATT